MRQQSWIRTLHPLVICAVYVNNLRPIHTQYSPEAILIKTANNMIWSNKLVLGFLSRFIHKEVEQKWINCLVHVPNLNNNTCKLSLHDIILINTQYFMIMRTIL